MYEIRTNSRIRMNFLHEKLVMLRMACTVLDNCTSFCQPVVKPVIFYTDLEVQTDCAFGDSARSRLNSIFH